MPSGTPKMFNSRIYLRKTITFIVLFILSNVIFASEYSYETYKTDTQITHILTLNPKNYEIKFVKANNGTGRETVLSIANRYNADIAINGGFFEKDGIPSGTLIINGHVYHKKNIRQALLIEKNKVLSIVQANPTKYITNKMSIVSGIPLLINKGQIPHDLTSKKTDFYIAPHARTALGIKQNGFIVIIVTEHSLQTNGLTILELAQLMKKLGCEYAINLDGGGSSTLSISGKVVNQPMGDIDEENGNQTLRPVSDAIIFKKITNMLTDDHVQ